ncbi:MAG TPA: hypothetical protein PLQ88_32880, partial [Blastocatellia bacterium]|nr:hypothetical protein [Blastocatellia bacterium]
MSLRQRQWLGAIIFVLMFGHFGVNAYFILVKLEQLGRSSDGWAARVRADGKAEITEVTRGGPATVLREGDELVSINGVSPKDNPELLTISRHVSPGTPYTIAVRRQGQLLEFTLATIARPLGQWLRPLADVFVPLLFLLTGLAVFLLKPADWQAWLLALMLSSFTGLFNEVLPPMPMMLSWWMVLARIMGILFLPIFFHFFLIFPERSPLLARFPRLERWLYLPFFFVLPWFAFSRMLAIFRTQAGLRAFFENAWVLKSRWMGLLSLSVAIGYLIAGLGALLVGYRSAGVAARRKLTVIVAGSIAGMANLLAIVIWETLFHSRFPNAREWLAMPLPLTLSLVPLSFAYAIARHQVIPVSLILRRGVRYVLVSRGSLALHLLLAMLAMFVFMEILFGATPNLSGRAIGAISCAVGIL